MGLGWSGAENGELPEQGERLPGLSSNEQASRTIKGAISTLPSESQVAASSDGEMPNLFVELVKQLDVTREDLLQEIPAQATEEFDLDGHVPAAMSILGLSPVIRTHRFQLVPALMNETTFWAHLFYILRTRKASNSAITGGQQTPSSSVSHLSHSNRFSALDTHSSSYSEYYSSAPDVKSPVLHATDLLVADGFQGDSKVIRTPLQPLPTQTQTQAQGGVNAETAQELHTLQAKVAELQALVDSMCKTCRHRHEVPFAADRHTGEWVMDKDSKDFWALDEELKNNLRSEKQKRLNEVQSQMKFILESDDISTSQGAWSCCQSPEYLTEVGGCKT